MEECANSAHHSQFFFNYYYYLFFYFFSLFRMRSKWMSQILFASFVHLLMLQNAWELRSVARGCSALKSCCFNSLLLTWGVMSGVGTRRRRALSPTYMWHIHMHTGMCMCKYVLIDGRPEQRCMLEEGRRRGYLKLKQSLLKLINEFIYFSSINQ